MPINTPPFSARQIQLVAMFILMQMMLQIPVLDLPMKAPVIILLVHKENTNEIL